MNDLPLAGLGVVVTRPAGTGGRLVAGLRALGADTLAFPAIVIEPIALDAVATASLRRLSGFDLVVFVSPSAVARLFDVRPGTWPAALGAAAVGAGTAAAVVDHGVANVIAPEAGAGAEALLALPELADMTGKRVLIAAGGGGSDRLENALCDRGAETVRVELYRRAPPMDGAALFEWLERQRDPALLVTSIAALDHLTALAADADRERLLASPLVVPSPRVVKQAEFLGYRHIIRAADATDAALIAALVRWRESEHS
ncbi:MAG TPA: uroporphyrinogen-III synthase [Gammaproteobacteria bacterium]|nr:uroporphyrinogen-III synthase [Gammaproteobacteria bacterium]